MAAGILIIDDEATLSRNIATYLLRNGYATAVAGTGEDGLVQVESFRPEAVLLDYALPGISGIEVLKRIRALDPGIAVIMMTGQGSELVAVEAMKAGAHDYLVKPVVLSEIRLRLEKLLSDSQRDEELTYHRQKVAAEGGLDQLIGNSPPMAALKDAIARLLDTEAGLADADLPSVLITGETGTGKELVARALHFGGPRAAAPFVEVNCSAIPGELLEAELFGYERGAFTDAKARKLGLIEAATGGTLFLDEIGDLDLRVQVKLLRVLEDKSIRRLGSVREQRADVRVVTATNRDLEQAVRDGQFRSDLLFRLRIVHFELPPLRVRGADILVLAAHYLDLHRRRYRKPRLHFTPEAERAMLDYPWPGNVRELRNLVEQAVIMTRSDAIAVGNLRLTSTLGTAVQVADAAPATAGRAIASATSAAASANVGAPGANLSFDDAERDLLTRALAKAEGNVSQAARLLGVSRDTVRYRMEKHRLKAVE